MLYWNHKNEITKRRRKAGEQAMYYFIVNPGSRSGNGKYVWQKAERILDQEDVEYRVFSPPTGLMLPNWPLKSLRGRNA